LGVNLHQVRVSAITTRHMRLACRCVT
jgi:hypothetical protein